MLELYVIRHGIASSHDDLADDDAARSLTKNGHLKMKKVAQHLKNEKIRFDLVIASPLVRSMESAQIINEVCRGSQDLVISDFLKPGAPYKSLIKFLNELESPKKVAIVGHEPFLGGFVSYCLTKKEHSFIRIKKGGVLVLETDGVLVPGRCVLSSLMSPKHMMEFAKR